MTSALPQNFPENNDDKTASTICFNQVLSGQVQLLTQKQQIHHHVCLSLQQTCLQLILTKLSSCYLPLIMCAWSRVEAGEVKVMFWKLVTNKQHSKLNWTTEYLAKTDR